MTNYTVINHSIISASCDTSAGRSGGSGLKRTYKHGIFRGGCFDSIITVVYSNYAKSVAVETIPEDVID